MRVWFDNNGGLASFVCIVTTTLTFAFYSLTTNLKNSGFCRIFATRMFQTSSKCYDRAVLLWSRPIVLATTLPNKEGSWVLGLQGSVAKDSAKPCTHGTVQVGMASLLLCKLWFGDLRTRDKHIIELIMLSVLFLLIKLFIIYYNTYYAHIMPTLCSKGQHMLLIRN